MLRPFQIALLASMACLQPIASTANAASRIPAAFSLQGRHPVRDWKAESAGGLFIEDRGSNWYYARLASACPDLESDKTIQFVSAPGGMFDGQSSLVVSGRPCPVRSVVAAAKPIMDLRYE